jgi:hypothetical protein
MKISDNKLLWDNIIFIMALLTIVLISYNIGRFSSDPEFKDEFQFIWNDDEESIPYMGTIKIDTIVGKTIYISNYE